MPIRQFAEMLGAEVTWDAVNRRVNIDTVNIDLVDDLQAAHESAVYQYLSVEKNRVLKTMAEDLKKRNTKGLATAVEEFERLAELTAQLNNSELSDNFKKLASSTELMRSALAENNFDDYYLAWNLFQTNVEKVNNQIKSFME